MKQLFQQMRKTAKLKSATTGIGSLQMKRPGKHCNYCALVHLTFCTFQEAKRLSRISWIALSWSSRTASNKKARNRLVGLVNHQFCLIKNNKNPPSPALITVFSSQKYCISSSQFKNKVLERKPHFGFLKVTILRDMFFSISSTLAAFNSINVFLLWLLELLLNNVPTAILKVQWLKTLPLMSVV